MIQPRQTWPAGSHHPDRSHKSGTSTAVHGTRLAKPFPAPPWKTPESKTVHWGGSGLIPAVAQGVGGKWEVKGGDGVVLSGVPDGAAGAAG